MLACDRDELSGNPGRYMARQSVRAVQCKYQQTTSCAPLVTFRTAIFARQQRTHCWLSCILTKHGIASWLIRLTLDG